MLYRNVDAGKMSCTNQNNKLCYVTLMWKVHFESLLNSVNMQHVKECVQNAGNCYNDNNIHISLCLVHNATDRLKSGKSCGNDGVSAKHFKLADRRINILMSIFYNSVITHGHLPDDFM